MDLALCCRLAIESISTASIQVQTSNMIAFESKMKTGNEIKKIHYLPVYSSGYGIIYPSGLGRGVLPTQKKASGPIPSYANPLMNNVDSSTA